MLCRALFAAIVVSYVLCVLLLSGVHREELDAATLRKLQQHNVNISDMDDQKLRKQCFTNNYVASLNLKGQTKTSVPPIAYIADQTTKAQVIKMVDYFKIQERNKNETTTESNVVLSDTIDLNSLFSFLKNISTHIPTTEVSTDSQLKVTNKDSAKPELKKIFDFLKKQAEYIKETTTKKVAIQSGDLDFNSLITPVKNHNMEEVKSNTEISQDARLNVSSKDVAKALLQKILDEYFKKQDRDIKATTSKTAVIQSGTTTKSNIADLSSLLSDKNHNVEFVSDSVSHISLKSVKSEDGEDSIVGNKENKTREMFNMDTPPDNSNLQIKPQVFNDIAYVSNIVAQILSQRHQNQARSAPPNSNEKKPIRHIDTVVDKISYIKTTSAAGNLLNDHNLSEKLEKFNTDESRNNRKDNDLIAEVLQELRNRDRLRIKNEEENSSKFGQYKIDGRNPKQFKNNFEEESEGAIHILRSSSDQGADVTNILRNRPEIEYRYKSKQPIDIKSSNSKELTSHLEEEEERKPFNQPSERDRTHIYKSINDYYPAVNRHRNNRLYFPEERDPKRGPPLEIKQKTDVLREQYKTMNNENYRSLDNAYKHKRVYSSENQNIKEINPSFYQTYGLESQFKSITNTINNKYYAANEGNLTYAYAWPAYYEDMRMTGNLQLRNKNELENKPNEFKRLENNMEPILTDNEHSLMDPVLSKWYKNKWPFLPSSISFDKEPKSTEELRRDQQLFNNRKIPYQNNYDLQIMNDNVLLENATTNDHFQKILMDEQSKNNRKKVLNVKDNSLTPKVLKEIADTVKAIVLEDLKNEKSTTNLVPTTPTTTTARTPTTGTASTTTTTPATTTTTELSTTTSKEEHKIQEATKALEQFMKMFEKFQLIKFQLSDSGNGTNQQPLNVTGKSNKPNKPVIKPPTPPFMPNVYEMRSQKRKNKIELDPFSDKEHWVQMQTVQLPPVKFQTNSYEIPPLRLPMERPMTYNTILITTKPTPSPYQQIRIPGNIANDLGSTYQSDKVDSYTRLNPRKSNYKDHSRFNYDGKSKPIHILKDHFHMERFHEKLERMNAGSPQHSAEKKICSRTHGCSDNISQRNQRPLSLSTTYDDKHFKNFLKTQQKVNAMLERILATKAKRDHPQSAEIV